MRPLRFLRPARSSVAVVHAMSRVIEGRMIFDDRAKEVFRKLLARPCAFSQVELVTFCLMGNHFILPHGAGSASEASHPGVPEARAVTCSCASTTTPRTRWRPPPTGSFSTTWGNDWGRGNLAEMVKLPMIGGASGSQSAREITCRQLDGAIAGTEGLAVHDFQKAHPSGRRSRSVSTDS